MNTLRPKSVRSPGGFTMVEVQLALTMLAIGLIGLLSVFPIGADWTRQITEESVAQNVARNAIGVILARYGPGGPQNSQMTSVTSSQVQAFPGFTNIPLGERAYQFGASSPYPANAPSAATYFWTALVRLCPDQTSSGNRFDVYILVTKKGQPSDLYNIATANGEPMTEVSGTRATDGSEDFVPMVVSEAAHAAAKNGSGEYIDASRNAPQIGDYGIGRDSGTVFRVAADGASIFLNPRIKNAGETVIWVPPSNPVGRPVADSTPSPLVFVYQTTVSF